MIPPDGSIKGFYPWREYVVVRGGQLETMCGEIVFWEFFTDGEHLVPLGEARCNPECEKLEVTYAFSDTWPPELPRARPPPVR